MTGHTPPHRLCAHLQNTSRAALARTSVPYTQSSLAITSILLRQGLISNLSLGSPQSPDPTAFASLPVSTRKLWVSHKYRDGVPVLRHINLVSKPSLKLAVTHDELGRLLTGRRAKNIPGVGMGEILVVRVQRDKAAGRQGVDTYMEGWEAWRAGLGGEIVCRAG